MLQSMNPGETFYRDSILLSILNILRNHVIKKMVKKVTVDKRCLRNHILSPKLLFCL